MSFFFQIFGDHRDLPLLPLSFLTRLSSDPIGFIGTRTGAKFRVIGAPALRVLREQPVQDGSPYVFPADGGQSHFVAADGVLGRICHGLGWTDVTAHTLRHTFGSKIGRASCRESVWQHV